MYSDANRINARSSGMIVNYTTFPFLNFTNLFPKIKVWVWSLTLKGAMSRCFSHFSDYFEIEGNLEII